MDYDISCHIPENVHPLLMVNGLLYSFLVWPMTCTVEDYKYINTPANTTVYALSVDFNTFLDREMTLKLENNQSLRRTLFWLGSSLTSEFDPTFLNEHTESKKVVIKYDPHF